MNTWTKVAAPLLLLLLPGSGLAEGGCAGCSWAPRGDRREGVRAEKAMISGASFELLSVAYRRRPESSGAGAELRLSFWLPQAARLDELLVWKPLPSKSHDKVAYRMEPERRDWPAGLASFSWPRSEVVAKLALSLPALHTRVRVGETFLPALLTTGEDRAATEGYAFVFASGAGIDAECAIRPAAAKAPIRRFECYQEEGGEVRLEWDGRDGEGRPAADGVYVLTVTGDMLAEVLRPLESSLSFHHKSRLE